MSENEQHPERPTPHPVAREKALQDRISVLRMQVANTENALDEANGLYMTEKENTLWLADQYSSMLAQVSQLKAYIQRLGGDPENIPPDPQGEMGLVDVPDTTTPSQEGAES